MKLAIPVVAANLDAALEPRFGRTPFFAICDSNGEEETQFIENLATQEAHGAGVMAAQILIDHDVEAVASQKYGPNGSQALQQAGIACYLFGDAKSISEVVEAFSKHTLKPFSS
jgi:predicted Fe-Mo cluster-binding NifX family protein